MENFNPNFLGLLAMSNESFSDHEIRAPNQLPVIHDQTSFDYPNHAPFYDPVAHHFSFPSIDVPTHECLLSDQAQTLMNSIPPVFETGLIGDNKAAANKNNYVRTFF